MIVANFFTQKKALFYIRPSPKLETTRNLGQAYQKCITSPMDHEDHGSFCLSATLNGPPIYLIDRLLKTQTSQKQNGGEEGVTVSGDRGFIATTL